MKADMRILVVDDEQGVRETISHILSEQGYVVKMTANGEEALALLRAESFPVVISDLVMNGMNGIELLKKVKHMRPETEVVIITGYASVETATAALRNGAFDYIMKNYDDLHSLPEVLARAEKKIRQAAGLRKKIQDLKNKNATLEHIHRMLRDSSVIDELTGLYNRRYFEEVLEYELSRSARFKRNLSLAFFTVMYGARENGPAERMENTQLLCDMARTVKQRLRKTDVFVRYEETLFAILLPETSREGARCVAESTRQLLAGHAFPGAGMGFVGKIAVNIGIATFPEDGGNGAILIQKAEGELLLEGKLSGIQQDSSA